MNFRLNIAKVIQISSMRSNNTWVPGKKIQFQPVATVNGKVFDPRKDREILIDEWLAKDNKNVIKFELLDSKDIDFMIPFVTECFTKINIMQALNLKPEVAVDMIGPLVEKWINCNNSVLYKNAKDNEIFGFSLNSLHTRDEFDSIYEKPLFQQNAKYNIKDDYADEINNGPFDDRNLNRIAVFLNDIETQTGKFLNSDTTKIGIVEYGATVPTAGRLGAMSKAAEISRQIFHRQKCNYEIGYCVAAGSAKMVKHWGWKNLFEFPYSKFTENGKPVFSGMYDHATSCCCAMGSIPPIKEN